MNESPIGISDAQLFKHRHGTRGSNPSGAFPFCKEKISHQGCIWQISAVSWCHQFHFVICECPSCTSPGPHTVQDAVYSLPSCQTLTKPSLTPPHLFYQHWQPTNDSGHLWRMDSLPDSSVTPETCLPPDPFDFGTRLGLTFITEASVFSAIAVLALLLYIIVSDSRNFRTHLPTPNDLRSTVPPPSSTALNDTGPQRHMCTGIS